MIEKGRKTVTLLLALGFIISALAVFAPVGAATGRGTPNFSVNVTFKNSTGVDVTSAQVGEVINITANASIVPAGYNVSAFGMKLTVNDLATGTDYGGALELDLGDFLENTWAWPVPGYGCFTINITATNGTDTDNQTVASNTFTGLDTDLTLGTLTVTPATGYVGLTSFTFTAAVNNAGNMVGPANVSLLLDNSSSMLIGYALADNVPAATGGTPGTANAVFIGMITASGLADYSNHTVTALLMDRSTTYSTSANVTLTNPAPNIVVNTLAANPASITITKGSTVNVVATANITNTGQLDAIGATVSFYETDTTAAKFTCDAFNLSVGDSTDIVWTWAVTDTVALGTHTIYVQVASQTQDMWTNVSVSIIGVANVTIASLVPSAATAFEGDNVTFTATLFNNGTEDSVNQTITWSDATGATPAPIGTTINVTVLKGQSKPFAFVWTLPAVDVDGNKTVKATIGSAAMSVNVMDRNKAPKIEIISFTIPSLTRIADVAIFQATLKNNGTGDAINMVVDFYDGTTKMASSAPFNLSVQGSKSVSVNVTLAGTADANHTFSVQALGAQKNITQSVGHKLAPAAIGIVSFIVKPTKKEGQAKDSTQDYKITITLRNTGEVMGMVILNITEKGKLVTIIPVPVILDGSASTTQNYTWKVKGDGDHTAVATISGDAGTPSTMSVKATLKYSPGFEVLALVAAIIVAVILVRRRKN